MIDNLPSFKEAQAFMNNNEKIVPHTKFYTV